MKHHFFLWGTRLIERGAWFFAPISWIWGLVSFFKNLLYDLGYRPVTKLPVTVVSVGNIVAGGTGKTPFVHLLAKTFHSKKVAILSRGYGPFADEAALLRRRLPNALVYVGRDRIASAKKAMADGADLLILDDGFQYRRLSRDFDVVLLDGSDPLGKGHYLPRGYLRESPQRLKGADFVFVNGSDVRLNLSRILDLQGNRIDTIQGLPVALFSGIAKPLKFKQTVERLGAQPMDHWILADHALIDPVLLKNFAENSKALGVEALLCTEKDFVRLPSSIDVGLPILFLEMEMEPLNRSSWEKLIAKIGQKIDNYSSL